MFRAIKDLLETLKMELGKIKITTPRIGFSAETTSLNPIFSYPEVFSEEISPSVESANFASKIPEVVNGTFSTLEVDIKSEQLNKETVKIRRSHISPPDLRLMKPEISPKSPRVIHGDIGSFVASVISSKRSASSVKDGISLSPIWTMTIEKSPIEDKDRILKALERALKNYKGPIEEIKFLGYFKNVPLKMTKKLEITEGKLIVHLYRRSSTGFYDIIAVKTQDKLKIEVVI